MSRTGEGDGEVSPDVAEQSTTPGRRRRVGPRIRHASDAQPELVSYRHRSRRLNNPEVGMVHAETDPDSPKITWAYDPHIDPALQFDIGRAQIEHLIDDALTGNSFEDPDSLPDAAARMRRALLELKRLQAPYLNWTGKAEHTSFEIDTLSLHVHERIDPTTILTHVRKQMADTLPSAAQRQTDLFAPPFEKLPLRIALDFYHHDKNWSNRLITGDSLLVMNSLIQKESMAGQVQMIYIDPPYGIKYGSNFQPFTNKREVKDGADGDLTQEPEMIKAFRDTWELGIHSYLTSLHDRLILAKELLGETGSLFVQISDANLHLVRNICDDVFRTENFVALITFVKTSGQTSDLLAGVSDYLVWYAKDRDKIKFRQLFEDKDAAIQGGGEYVWLRTPEERERTLSREERKDFELARSRGRIFRHDSMVSQGFRQHTTVEVDFLGQTHFPGMANNWKTTVSGIKRLGAAGRLVSSGTVLKYKRFLDDFPVIPIGNNWTDTATGGSSTDPRVYVVQTVTRVIERCLLMTTDPGDLVLDPTCGSGTTAYVAEKWGRRWITCDTSRVAVTLAKQRLTTASYDYYILRYPHEGLKGGFAYSIVPHVTLKSIASNSDIDSIYERMHPPIETALAALNAALVKASPSVFISTQGVRKGQGIDLGGRDKLLEWEVPFAWPDLWDASVRPAFDAFHDAHRAMQRQMDAAIAANAEPATLYDKPEIDPKRLRITGPFSVEAVPSPTVMSLDESQPPAEANITVARSGETSRQSIWRDELIKTGIRGKAGQMLRLVELETIPGLKHLHSSGSLADSGERVVVSFGPEHAALEQRQVELALVEAETLRPIPRFIVFCASPSTRKPLRTSTNYAGPA